jgi:hypothetical protein
MHFYFILSDSIWALLGTFCLFNLLVLKHSQVRMLTSKCSRYDNNDDSIVFIAVFAFSQTLMNAVAAGAGTSKGWSWGSFMVSLSYAYYADVTLPCHFFSPL